MEKKIIRFFIIFFLAILQSSFSSSFFGDVFGMQIALLAVVAWTITSGFELIWLWIVLLGLLVDLISFDPVGVHIIMYTIIAFLVSFLSRRFIIENKSWGFIIMLAFASGSIFISDIGFALRDNEFSVSNLKEFFSHYLPTLPVKIFWSSLLFLVIYWMLNKLEKYISFYERRIQLKIK